MQAYIWLEKERAEEVLAGGLRPEGEGIEGLSLPRAGGGYIAALLNPADDYATAGSAGLVCLRLNVDAKKAYVIDTARIEGKIADTLAPAEKYVFGTYRRPLLVIPEQVEPENIKKYEGVLDAPVLYENSEKIYIDRQFALADDNDPGFREIALRAYHEKQAAAGRAVKYSGGAFRVKERIKTGKKPKKSEKSGIFRLFSAKTEGKNINGASGTGTVIEETVVEYAAPDGKPIGIYIDKKPTKG